MDTSHIGRYGIFFIADWFKKKVTAPYTNEEWVEFLSEPVDNKAVKKLKKILIKGLKPALIKYVDREPGRFVEEVAQEALLKILDSVETYRGIGKFNIWAMKIAVREGLAILRREKWKNTSINDLKNPNSDSDLGEIYSDTFATCDSDSKTAIAPKKILEKVQHVIQNVLTGKELKAINAVMIHGLPLSVVAEQMGTNRENLYKLLYEARKKLSYELEVRGIDPEEVLEEISKN